MASCFRLRNWADLPTELLCLVLDKLVLLPDFIRFGAVCKQWRFATLHKQQDRIKNCLQEPPMLLIPYKVGSKDHQRFYSIWENKIYPHRLQIPYGRRCCGSSYGWLAFVDDDDDDMSGLRFTVTLLNPFSAGTAIRLPPIKKCPDEINPFLYHECYPRKLILSCDPNLHPKDWIAVAIVGGAARVAFIRSGEELWTYPCDSFTNVTDALFYQGKLYALNFIYHLVAIDFSRMREDWGSDNRVVTNIRPKSPRSLVDHVCSYLVEVEGDLLLVRRNFKHVGNAFGREKTVVFNVRKLSHNQLQASDSGNTPEWVWVDIEDLGKFSLFLGSNASVAISASNVSNIQPNCIYYSGEFPEGGAKWAYHHHEGMGMFDLATGEISKYYTLEHSRSQRNLVPVVWISPKLGQTLLG